MKRLSLAALLLAAAFTPAYADDFGMARDQMLASQTVALFGLDAPLADLDHLFGDQRPG